MKKIFSLFAVLFVAISFVSAQEINFVQYQDGDYTKASSADETSQVSRYLAMNLIEYSSILLSFNIGCLT